MYGSPGPPLQVIEFVCALRMAPAAKPGRYNSVICARLVLSYETQMTTFLFRCPATGYSVQGLAAEAIVDPDTYQSVSCPACTRTHLVNPKTGKVAGAEPIPPRQGGPSPGP